MPRRVTIFTLLDALATLGPATPLELAFYFGQGAAGVARIEGLLRGPYLKRSVFWVAGRAHLRAGDAGPGGRDALHEPVEDEDFEPF
jgi:hypothetical protein